jgi:hypothetical protein
VDQGEAPGVLVGERIGDALHFLGILEWGFRAADVLKLLRETKYAPQRRLSPFVDLPRMRGGVWLNPRPRAEISYAEMATGQLRALSWPGLICR